MQQSIKILSDFDGVWTNQGPEARALLDAMTIELSRLAGVPIEQAREDVETMCGRMRAEPHAHGWAPDGRISAYVDEDPLCEPSALCRLVDVASDETSTNYRAAVLAGGHASLAAFAEFCFFSATESFRRDHPPCLIPDAREVLAALHAVGAEVVVISNSRADKIIGWFEHAGIDAGETPGHALRVRGAAAKWFLGPTHESITVADRRIVVDRPKYREAIEAERPALVIGDVFSLDLSLPHVMRTATGFPSTLVLRRHRHTPAWVLQTWADGAIDHVVDGLAELPAIVETLR